MSENRELSPRSNWPAAREPRERRPPRRAACNTTANVVRTHLKTLRNEQARQATWRAARHGQDAGIGSLRTERDHARQLDSWRVPGARPARPRWLSVKQPELASKFAQQIVSGRIRALAQLADDVSCLTSVVRGNLSGPRRIAALTPCGWAAQNRRLDFATPAARRSVRQAHLQRLDR